MPTYQYLCPHCGHQFEEYQAITDDPIEICPQCKEKIHRVISGGAGFLFKGSGFYITDNRSKDYKSKAAADKASGSSGSSSSSSSTSDSSSPNSTPPASKPPDK